MSALLPKADIERVCRDIRKVLEADAAYIGKRGATAVKECRRLTGTTQVMKAV